MNTTNNTTVLFIDQQAHQGRHRKEGKKSVGEHLTNTYNNPLGGSHTHDLGASLGCPLTVTGNGTMNKIVSGTQRERQQIATTENRVK